MTFSHIMTAADYLRMAEELETMAGSLAPEERLNHHFSERLTLLAKQLREDGAGLTPGSSQRAG